jgi:hypothetical protein
MPIDNTQSKPRVETITQVPQVELANVLRDFKNSGATVRVEEDGRGTFTVFGDFSTGSVYQASGVRSV